MDKSSLVFLLALAILQFQLLSAATCEVIECDYYDYTLCNTQNRYSYLGLCKYITQKDDIYLDFWRSFNTLLITNSTLTTIANNFFTKLQSIKLENLYLNNSQIGAIEPEGFNYLHNLLYLNIADNSITKLVTGTFDGLNKLQFLNISHNLISILETDLFSDLKVVTIIDLSYNKLVEMDNKIFHRNNKLNTLDIIKNSLTLLSKRTFDGLSKLDHLKLSYNAISVIEQDTFSNLKFIQEIDLSYNNLSNIPDYIFNNLDNLCNLNLSRNNIVSFNMSSNTNMSTRCYGAIFDLSYNKLLHLDYRIFELKKIHILKVNNNYITFNDIETPEDCDLSYNTEINSALVNNSRNLKLHHTLVKSMVEFGTLIIDLDLISTMIPLYLTTFKNATSLERLLLDNNNLKNINEDVFESTVNLIYLSLRNNSISSLPIGLFRSLYKLQSLNLDNNNIFHFEIGIFSNLQHLKELNLGKNKLNNLDVHVFYNLQRIEYINLANNLLSFVNLEELALHIHQLDRYKILLVLDNNYWLCNWLVKAKTFTENNIIFAIQNGNSFKVKNVNGIACRSNNTLLNIPSQKPDQKMNMLSILTPPSTFPSTSSITKTSTRSTLEQTSITFRDTFLNISSQKPEPKVSVWQTLTTEGSSPSTTITEKIVQQFEETTNRINADNITKVKPIDNESSTLINKPDPLQERIFSFEKIQNHLDEIQDSLNEIKNNSRTDIRGLIIFAIILLCIIILSLFYFNAQKIQKSKSILKENTFQSCTMELIENCKNDDNEI